MNTPSVEERLAHSQARLETVEKLLADKSRSLLLANQQVERADIRLKNIIDSMFSSLIITDSQGIIQTFNQLTLDLLGYEAQELEGQPLSAIAVDLPPLEVLDKADPLVRKKSKYKTSRGVEIPVIFSNSAIRDSDGMLDSLVCIALDITNYNLLESQLLQSEKMASIGQLAAGVAHEINNPMGFIFSNLGTLNEYIQDITELIEAYKNLEQGVQNGTSEAAKNQLEKLNAKKEELELDYLLNDIDELIKESRDGADRVRKIVLNLKEFSHVGRDEKVPSNINDGLESTINIVWNELKYKVTLQKNYGDIPEVTCHLQEVNQVFMNLLVNAGQSIAEQGEIKIHTYEETDHVCIGISDTGKGMPPEVKDRIFEPFFTTKKVGEGTGLGLSVGYQIIVDKHGGELLVESEENVGTTFTVKLPKVATGQ